jgi:hypothetical protein
MTSLIVHAPLAIRRRGGRKRVVAPEGAPGVTVLPTRADPALVKALARGFRYRKLLDQGRYASISEMAAAEKIDRGLSGAVAPADPAGARHRRGDPGWAAARRDDVGGGAGRVGGTEG